LTGHPPLSYTLLTMPHAEHEPESSVYNSDHFAAEISETPDTLTAKVTSGTEIVIFRYTPPGQVSVELLQGKQASVLPLPSSSGEQQQSPETEPTVRIYGRTATDPFSATAPSGDPMLVVSFAEHPSWDTQSFSNTHAKYTKNDTRYWQVAAFGDYRQVLEGLPKGKACVLIGYPKEIKKQGKAGKEETIKSGFAVVSREAYRGMPKPRS
jgi:hypothetical protein